MEDKTGQKHQLCPLAGRSSQSLRRLRLERLWRTRLWPEASTVSPSWEAQPVSQTAEIREALGQDSSQKHQLCPLAGRSSQSLRCLRLERLWRTRLADEADGEAGVVSRSNRNVTPPPLLKFHSHIFIPKGFPFLLPLKYNL